MWRWRASSLVGVLAGLSFSIAGITNLATAITIWITSAVILAATCIPDRYLPDFLADFVSRPTPPRLHVARCAITRAPVVIDVPGRLEFTPPEGGLRTIYGPGVVHQGITCRVARVTLAADPMPAKRVMAKISYSDKHGRSLTIARGRWRALTQRDDHAPRGEECVTLRGRSRELEIAVVSDVEPARCYAFDNNSVGYPGWSKPEYQLDGEVLVTVRFTMDNGPTQTNQFDLQPTADLGDAVRRNQSIDTPYVLYEIKPGTHSYLS